MGKIITFDNEARNKILSGITKLSKAVISTLGPKGSCVIISNGNRHPFATKDGVTVSESISFSDRYEDIGASIIQEAAHKTNTIAGDGTTTATLITSELCKAGNELVSLNFDATDVKRGFEKAMRDMLEEIERQKKLVESEDDILHIATISANNDPEIGGYLKEAFINIGEGGMVSVQPAYNKEGKTTITYSTGFEYNKGWPTSKLCNTNSDTCEFVNPKYFLYGKRLESIQDIYMVSELIGDKPLVVIAPAYSDNFMADFIELHENQKINGIFLVPDGTSTELITDNLGDMAAYLGAQIFEGRKGKPLRELKSVADLGGSEYIKIAQNKITITGGSGSEEAVNARIDDIKKAMENGMNNEDEAKSIYEIEFMNERIAKLSGGIATIHIGAFSDIEAKEKKDRYDDARNAVENAIKEGILAGGGCGLLHAVKAVSVKHTPLDNSTEEKGYQTFLKVMEMPARTIIASTGKDPGYWVEKIKESENNAYGYNAKTETWTDDMYKDGIIDPVKVELTALKYGTSIAGTFITSNCVIVPDTGNISVSANDEVLDRDRGLFGDE